MPELWPKKSSARPGNSRKTPLSSFRRCQSRIRAIGKAAADLDAASDSGDRMNGLDSPSEVVRKCRNSHAFGGEPDSQSECRQIYKGLRAGELESSCGTFLRLLERGIDRQRWVIALSAKEKEISCTYNMVFQHLL